MVLYGSWVSMGLYESSTVICHTLPLRPIHSAKQVGCTNSTASWLTTQKVHLELCRHFKKKWKVCIKTMPTLSDGSPLYSLSQPGDGETWRPHLLCLRCCAAQQVCLLSTGNHGPKHVTWISNRKGKKSSRPRKRKKTTIYYHLLLCLFSRGQNTWQIQKNAGKPVHPVHELANWW